MTIFASRIQKCYLISHMVDQEGKNTLIINPLERNLMFY